jgi:thymidylate synthase
MISINDTHIYCKEKFDQIRIKNKSYHQFHLPCLQMCEYDPSQADFYLHPPMIE